MGGERGGAFSLLYCTIVREVFRKQLAGYIGQTRCPSFCVNLAVVHCTAPTTQPSHRPRMLRPLARLCKNRDLAAAPTLLQSFGPALPSLAMPRSNYSFDASTATSSSQPADPRVNGSSALSATVSQHPPAPPAAQHLLTPLPNVRAPIDKNVRELAAVAASRDLRSDTVTTPTARMGEAMAGAAGYDNVMGDDVVSNNFEASVAALFGKRAGLFVTSGTLSNQLCLRTWLMQPPYSILCDARSHIHKYEAGGCAFHSGAALELVQPSNGLYLRWEQDIKPRIVPDDGNIHSAPTAIVSLENTLNGVIMPQDEVVRIAQGVRATNEDVKLHLDGARIWNVAAKTGLSLEELCRPFDSISVCFSKGLGSPVGRCVAEWLSLSNSMSIMADLLLCLCPHSMMLGPQRFITKANHFRKLFGGGMRQVAPLTAAARVAYEEHFGKLAYTHELATWLADALRAEGVDILLPVDTNMVSLGAMKRSAGSALPMLLLSHRIQCSHLHHLFVPSRSLWMWKQPACPLTSCRTDAWHSPSQSRCGHNALSSTTRPIRRPFRIS